MNSLFLTNLFAGKVTHAFCWMLIHSLWQGLFFTVVTGAIMMLTKRAKATVRYNIVGGLFFLFITICGFTFIRELNYTDSQVQVLQYTNTVNISENGLLYFFIRMVDYSSSHASLIVTLWFTVFCCKVVKLATAFAYNNRVKSHRVIPSAVWKNKIANLCDQLQIKRTVSLFESKILKIPVVIGHLKPIIFIPVGLLTNLSAGEVEAVLLHELAHIRRNDYVVNIIQVIAESIFFFNPSLLWMSQLLREEREHCCDDVAIAHLKSKKQYIQALISFKEHALYATSYATAFPGSKNLLLKRVARIIHNRNNTLDRAGKTFFLVSFLLLAFLSIAATNWHTDAVVTKRVKKEAPAVTLLQALKVQLKDTKRIAAALQRNVIVKKGTRRNTPEGTNFNRDISLTDTKDTKPKPVVTKAYKKTVITETKVVSVSNAEQTTTFANTKLTFEQQVYTYSQQAEKSREQAAQDRKQAELDRMQAEKDRQQALKDRAQAALDRIQAEKDRLQADKDRQQAEQDRQRAEKERLNIRHGM